METREIAEAWRAEAVSQDIWTVCERQAGLDEHNAQGLYMECRSVGWRRAYVKPKFSGGLDGRAAREKIAADLAYDLGVPVPPVTLVSRNDAGLEQHRYVSASLVMFKTQYSWGQVRNFIKKAHSKLGRQVRSAIARDAAWALAFDTWVGQGDHHPDHPHNVILGWDDEQPPRFIFVDYEYAFGGANDSWRGERAKKVWLAPFPEEFLGGLDTCELHLAIRAIEKLDAGRIASIIERIPKEFLSVVAGSEILAGLIARRGLVREALQATLS